MYANIPYMDPNGIGIFSVTELRLTEHYLGFLKEQQALVSAPINISPPLIKLFGPKRCSNYFPGKLTCPAKINDWKMYFPLK